MLFKKKVSNWSDSVVFLVIKAVCVRGDSAGERVPRIQQFFNQYFYNTE
jgi:hypothetical protein